MTNPTNHWLNFIGGQWVDADRATEVFDPATGESFATIACADVDDVNLAVEVARACVDSGVLTDCRPAQRAQLMHRIADEIRKIADQGAPLLARENGKTLADAREEFMIAARYFEYYAGMADKIEGRSIPLGADYVDFTYYEPVGISAQIVPWNFPVDICARSLAPALAAGNAVVVKSPEITPLAMTWLATACQRAGLPQGALSMLSGPGRKIGAALVSHPDINQIVFTGSVPTGQSILRAAAENAVPSVMELGGKSAAVVFPDTDMEQLLDSVRWGIFFNAGQVCSAMSRLLVHRDIYDQVVERVAELAQGLRIGAGLDNAELTPLVSAQQQQQVLRICDQAVAQGARLVTGGKAPADRKGYFVEATVFADVTPEMSLFTDEVFGPVIAITPFDDEQQAWELANGTDFGLVAGVFTRDLSRAMRASKALKAGQVFVNEWYAGGIETPFGGLKLSGFGREKGQEALYSYVNTKNVAIRVSQSD
ncbi:aldehyde dehydrogenase family protein [Marinobacterium arenosum]|uniref:aldehyde dehydrogenase family protein n=1 Tax=Marinobacterium arenosum TaxID=2862496 RepID=UPI001C982DC7|nr:aldehyde dehydrogenase family protein [Marinobacterium arenosum]MBY4675162.1 aldehyde dehydrogenase family protein [Marinobacterium arenosum]